MDSQKILVGSPVCQKPEILKAFLNSLNILTHSGFTIDYAFVDDNKDENSRQLLNKFQREGSSVNILKAEGESTYHCNEESHHWDDNLMLRVANYKNTIIKYAIDEGYHALFFADSDLVLHPGLIEHLKRAGKEVISEIFWTSWHPGKPEEPNVWLYDEYDLVPKSMGEILSEEEKDLRRSDFLDSLKAPGIYEVGGLGACTLISRSALLKGVDFSPIKNLTIHGEDRFFCIRAAVLGIELFVDTVYPAFHIYREKDLDGLAAYIKCNRKDHKVTLSMVVRNEEDRYLRRMLGSLQGHIDEAVIIDDASDDNTIKICEELLSDIPLHLIRNDKQMFTNEVELRKKQWEETIKTCPDWILNLDADEIIEEGFWDCQQDLLRDPHNNLCRFRLYDMWNESEYRDDEYWNAHTRNRAFMVRFQPDFSYKWKETPQHCGRFPINIEEFKGKDSEFGIQHFGWAAQKDRVKKYGRYQQMDPDAVYGVQQQYNSILDDNPHLEEYKQGECHQK